MSSAAVDPALFRLRTFEEEWIEPLSTSSAERQTPLDQLLLVEARGWVALGKTVGYFADRPLLTPLSPCPDTAILRRLAQWIATRSAPPTLTAATFGRALSDAREDLTVPRRELLNLLLFESAERWAVAINEVDEFAEVAQREAPLSHTVAVGGIAWALEGTLSDADRDLEPIDLRLPAGWRRGSLASLASCSTTAAVRLASLIRARAAIAEAVQAAGRARPKIVVAQHDVLHALAGKYNPRLDTGIPTEPVGALPWPSTLQTAYADYDAGKLSKEDLEKEQDAAVKDSIERQEATGQPINSDGGQRWLSFATYPIADTLAGTGLAENLGPGGQFFAIFADGSGRQLPKLTGGPLKYNFYAADTLKKSLPYASKPMKQAVIAPSMLALLYPLKDPVEGYSREEFEEDIVQECVIDIRKCFEAGAVRVSIDFTEGRLATRDDPRNPWTGAGLLPHFIELNNRVLANFSDEERRNIGIHTCPGGDRDSVHSADVPYNNLLPEMFKINAGYFLIQVASERDKDSLYESIGQHSREDQMCYIGVTVTQSPRPESAQEICDAIVRAADFIPKERLGTTDDCGFSPFSIAEKPTHSSPDYAREIAFQKIANRVEGTRRAAETLRIS